MRCHPIGDRAIRVEPAPSGAVDRLRSVAGVEDAVVAFGAVTVFYDPAKIAGIDQLSAEIAAVAAAVESTATPPVLHTIPVCYDIEFGLDLGELADRLRTPANRIVEMHAAGEYAVAAVGFMPGFGYLTGLPEPLRTERRATPRPSVPGGSVGIGSSYTGVYPRTSPGGWHIVGRTPLRLFDPTRADAPAVLRAGDRVRFVPIDRGAFDRWK